LRGGQFLGACFDDLPRLRQRRFPVGPSRQLRRDVQPVLRENFTARAAMVGLSFRSDRRHVARAAFDSIAFQIREALDAMRAEGQVRQVVDPRPRRALKVHSPCSFAPIVRG
jgi:hypothetical protein